MAVNRGMTGSIKARLIAHILLVSILTSDYCNRQLCVSVPTNTTLSTVLAAFVAYLAGSLDQNELTKSLHRKTSSKKTLNGRERRAVPTINTTSIDEPLQFSLGQHHVVEVQAAKVFDEHIAQTQNLENPIAMINDRNAGRNNVLNAAVGLSVVALIDIPLVKRVAIVVFRGTHGMRDAFDRIDNGACKIVQRVCKILGSTCIHTL
jgi:hypothetical protein